MGGEDIADIHFCLFERRKEKIPTRLYNMYAYQSPPSQLRQFDSTILDPVGLGFELMLFETFQFHSYHHICTDISLYRF